MPFSLADLWLALIAFFLLYYVATDGFALGVGLLTLLPASDEERGAMMGSLAEIWHSNQTWLVILGGMLFGAFPLFYSVLLSSLYVPIVAMLVGFALRGVAFEFREHSRRKRLWLFSFGFGSLVATSAQGLALGGLLGGLNLQANLLSLDLWEWATPFSLLVTLGALCGYAMLGAGYLAANTEGRLRERSLRRAKLFAWATAALSGCVHVAVGLRFATVARKWADPSTAVVLAVPLFYALIAFAAYQLCLRTERVKALLPLNAALIFLSFLSLSLGLYPQMIPGFSSRAVTVRQAAASSGTLSFMLAVTAVLVPVILAYRWYALRVAREARGAHGEEGSAWPKPPRTGPWLG